MRPRAFRQVLWQAPVLAVLALGIAIGVNLWRDDGIPLVGEWSVEKRLADASGKSLAISLQEAGKLYELEGALFLDARPETLYREGRIRGALNLPWQEVDRYFPTVMDRLDREKTLVTYCDGQACELSHELALFLNQMGFENVRVLANGWTLWQEAGLPLEHGD